MVSRKTRSFGRASRLIQLGGSLAGSYLAYQVERVFLSAEEEDSPPGAWAASRPSESARIWRSLRGPIMKIGQALKHANASVRCRNRERAGRITDAGAADAFDLDAGPIQRALFGKNPEDVFASFEPQPFAAASLGQVHWAVTKNGDEVAVKIQYPAIREAVESDFQMLRTVGFPARLSGHLQASVVNEVERGILEETDYVKEADNIEHFRKHLAPLPFVRVPKVHRELSCDRVLTMSRVRGTRLQEFLETNPSQALRDKIGAGLTRLFFFQLFKLEALHAGSPSGQLSF